VPAKLEQMSMNHKITYAIAAFIGLFLFDAQAVRADPMRCSGEEKTCNANCMKNARTELANCLANCHTSRQVCTRTGCWDTGTSRYCGLMKQ
jgi:hypothetical protein